MGADDQLRRCLEKGEWKQVICALHSDSSGGLFAAITTMNQISWILVAVSDPRCQGLC